MELKYIMIDGAFPVIFSPAIQHKQFRSLGKITSAGFVKLLPGDDREIQAHTYGESTSLGLQTVPRDAEIISIYLSK